MQDVNFLPARYQQRRVRQVNWRWRALVAFAFASLIAAGWWSQRVRRHELHAALEAARLNRETAEQQALLLAAAEQSLAERTTMARLLLHLRRPWPRSNLVASVTRCAPAEIRLLELTVSSAALDESTHLPSSVERRGDEAQPPPPGAAGDLQRLQAAQPAVTQIRVQGQAELHAAVDQYLSALSTRELIQAVELVNLEAQEGSHSTCQFELKIRVAPAHGEQGGPTAPPAAETGPAATVAGR